MGVAHGFFSFWISPTVDWRSKCGYIIKYVQCVTHTTFASLSWMYTESYRKMQKYTFWGYFNWTPHKKSIFVNRTSGLYWSGYGKLKRSYVESDIVFIFAQVLSLSLRKWLYTNSNTTYPQMIYRAEHICIFDFNFKRVVFNHD